MRFSICVTYSMHIVCIYDHYLPEISGFVGAQSLEFFSGKSILSFYECVQDRSLSLTLFSIFICNSWSHFCHTQFLFLFFAHTIRMTLMYILLKIIMDTKDYYRATMSAVQIWHGHPFIQVNEWVSEGCCECCCCFFLYSAPFRMFPFYFVSIISNDGKAFHSQCFFYNFWYQHLFVSNSYEFKGTPKPSESRIFRLTYLCSI